MIEIPEDIMKVAEKVTVDNLVVVTDGKFKDAYISCIADAIFEERKKGRNRIDGLLSDLEYAVEVAWNHGAEYFVKMNYPDAYKRFKGDV